MTDFRLNLIAAQLKQVPCFPPWYDVCTDDGSHVYGTLDLDEALGKLMTKKTLPPLRFPPYVGMHVLDYQGNLCRCIRAEPDAKYIRMKNTTTGNEFELEARAVPFWIYW